MRLPERSCWNMSDFLNNNRWSVSEDDFAVRVMIPDVKGFFKGLTSLGSSQLIIEPGTRALVVEDGVLVGEVPPGSYTLESFDERLQFWRKKQSPWMKRRKQGFR